MPKKTRPQHLHLARIGVKIAERNPKKKGGDDQVARLAPDQPHPLSPVRQDPLRGPTDQREGGEGEEEEGPTRQAASVQDPAVQVGVLEDNYRRIEKKDARRRLKNSKPVKPQINLWIRESTPSDQQTRRWMNSKGKRKWT